MGRDTVEEAAEELRDRGLTELVMRLIKTRVPREQWDTIVGRVWESEYTSALKVHLEGLTGSQDPSEMGDWEIRTRCRVGPISVDNEESGPLFAGHTYHFRGSSKPSSGEKAVLRTRIFQMGFERQDTVFQFKNVLVEDSEKTVQPAAELEDDAAHGHDADVAI